MRKLLVLGITVGLFTTAVTALAATFTAQLSGADEVPPRDTRARGNAIFHVSADGTELTYKLIVANIEDVTAAHIHLAPEGVNGPVVALLYSAAASGRLNGVIAEGTITAADLQGPLAGQQLSALISAIEAGNTYVNVHTIVYPGGEIRGQIH
jgi:hypothetical protein